MLAGLKLGLNVGLGCIGMCIVACVTGASIGIMSGSGGGMSRGEGCCAKCLGCFGFCYYCLVSLGIFAWIVTDWVLFGINEIPDGNGVELQPW